MCALQKNNDFVNNFVLESLHNSLNCVQRNATQRNATQRNATQRNA
jgi:hypothetical protein